MLGYIELLRPKNCLMAVFAVFIGSLLVLRFETLAPDMISLWMPTAYAISAAFLITGAGNAINDYFDVETDKLNRPKRPIPSGRVSRNSSLAFSVILFIAGILISALTNFLTFGIAIANSLLLVVYSWSLQHKTFFGNFTVAYLTGSTFLFGGAAVGNISLPLLFGLLAGLTIFSREIVKDLEDIEGDRKAFIEKQSVVKKRILERFTITKEGVSLKVKERTGLMTAGMALSLAILLSPMPYFLSLLTWHYLVLVIPADLAFLLCVLGFRKAKKTQDFSRLSKILKYGYLLGLLAFVGGVLLLSFI
jgi:geranylgeranylglycerol-phosphate geranylgeranyltransferase